MALNITTITATQPGSTGSQTYELGDNFDPVCGIVVAAPVATDGIVAHASFSIGYFSYRGSVVQQGFSSSFAEDNAATSDTYAWSNTDAVARLMDATGVQDLNVTFTGLTSGAGADITLNWTDLHATASVRLFIMVFGGSDVLDAQAHTFALTAATGAQDIALGSGFGHPHVVFFAGAAMANGAASVADAQISPGFGITGVDGRGFYWGSQDAQATEASAQQITSTASAYMSGTVAVLETKLTLGAEVGYPTDGYEVNKSTSAVTDSVIGLAIRFSANVTITSGNGAAPITGTPPVTQNLAVGTSVPRGLVVLHTHQATAGAIDTSSATCAVAGIGLCDGQNNERWVGCWDDDGQATASVASSGQSEAKTLRNYLSSTDALDSEADCSVSGSNFQLSWNDISALAWVYQWIAFGVTTPPAIPDVIMAPMQR